MFALIICHYDNLCSYLDLDLLIWYAMCTEFNGKHNIILLLQITIPECGVTVEFRFGHSATAIPRNPSLIEVTIFGGCLDFDFIQTEAEHLLLPGTMVLKFGMLPIPAVISEIMTLFYFPELRPDKDYYQLLVLLKC